MMNLKGLDSDIKSTTAVFPLIISMTSLAFLYYYSNKYYHCSKINAAWRVSFFLITISIFIMLIVILISYLKKEKTLPLLIVFIINLLYFFLFFSVPLRCMCGHVIIDNTTILVIGIPELILKVLFLVFALWHRKNRNDHIPSEKNNYHIPLDSPNN